MANGFASPERLNGLKESYHDFVDQWISIPAEEVDTSGESNNPFEDAGANVIEVVLGGVDPENVPTERVNKMLQSGQAVEFERRIGLSTYTAIGMWVPLSDGSFRSLVLEKVRHWFSSPTWQIVGVGPGKTMSLEQIVDSFVFSPKAASSAQSQANAAQFVLHVIPLGGFADHLSQGDYKEAVISIASDAATLLTGGGSKAISATRAAKSLGATQAGLRTAGLAIESSIIGIRGLEGGVKLTNGNNANAEVAEVILRLFGVKSKISGNASGVARITEGAASSNALNSGRLVYDAASKTWTSPGGLIYGHGSKHGNRVKHVLDHLKPNAGKPTHTLFNVNRDKLIGILDEAWAKKGAAVPGDPGAFIVDMGRIIGANGERFIKLIVKPGTNKIITAYPVIP